MSEGEFRERCLRVVDWFRPLNPYESANASEAERPSILKIETENFSAGSQAFQPLFSYAISAKRYALFNLDAGGRPIIRKASAHGLGHLMEPYPESDPAPGVPPPVVPLHKIGVKRWQYDFWYHILLAALAGTSDRVRRDYHPALLKPALMRYAATSPALLRWMKHFNEGKAYAAQVKPFGFMVAPMAEGLWLDADAEVAEDLSRGRPVGAHKPRPIAPYERDPAIAASRAFDRVSGDAVPVAALKSYADALRLYHLSSEDKFENGGPCDTGVTRRRHLSVTGIRLIGKEANKVDDAGMRDPVAAAVVVFTVDGPEPTL